MVECTVIFSTHTNSVVNICIFISYLIRSSHPTFFTNPLSIILKFIIFSYCKMVKLISLMLKQLDLTTILVSVKLILIYLIKEDLLLPLVILDCYLRNTSKQNSNNIYKTTDEFT